MTSPYWIKAQETHNFSVGNILSAFHSYKETPGAGTSDTWHNASQIWADSLMVSLGDGRYQAYMNETYTRYMGFLWDSLEPAGGYFARANLDGGNVDKTLKYVDDNALTGVAYLDAYHVTQESNQRAAYLTSAREIANWLMFGNVWDTTFDGGFWWRTGALSDGRPAKMEKPAEVNGLALTLFLQLYQITNEVYYRDWAISIDEWLDHTLFDHNTGLYWRQIIGSSSGVIDQTFFTYDQAILIQGKLLLHKMTGDPKHLHRAKQLGTEMISRLWDRNYGGFIIQFGTPKQGLLRSPVYSAWGSEGLIRLHDYEHGGQSTSNWLTHAQENVDVLNRQLRDMRNYGYYANCAPDGGGKSSDQQAVDQAWMQRVMAMLSRYI